MEKSGGESSFNGFENDMNPSKNVLNFKKGLVEVQLKISALKRQLEQNCSDELSQSIVGHMSDECNCCWDAVTAIHAQILECPGAKSELECMANKLEDEILAVKAKCKSAGQEITCASSKPRVGVKLAAEQVPPRSEGRRAESGLDPMAAPYQFSRITSSPKATYQDNDYRSVNQEYRLPPGLKLTLECFEGDVLKYFGFKQRFKRHVEGVYCHWEDRMAFLESLCKGKAHEVISGLSCFANSKDAYSRAWSRLDARFGDTRKLMARLREELLVGPPIRESDCDSLLELSDKMYQCEASFEGCGKSWMLNSQDFCIVFLIVCPIV